MSDQFEYLAEEDIISMPAEGFQHVIGHTTFKSIEFLEALSTYISESMRVNEAWVYEGIDCRVLSAGQYWRRGKLRLALEFIPDEPDYDADHTRQIAAVVEDEYPNSY